jgi:glycosyltransferase involved in cell wall biosynthesis
MVPAPLVAVMPVYNEQACIEQVAREWLACLAPVNGSLLIVDDGSRDQTPAILARLAKSEPRVSFLTQLNAGHGPAILAGYRHALSLHPAYVLQVDSDGEMPSALFPGLWDARNTAPFLLGARINRGGHPLRLALSTIHRHLLHAVFGVALRDPNIPFRLMRAAELGQLLDALPAGLFAPNVFLSLMAARRGWLAYGPEVPLAPRAGGVASIRGWRTAKIAARCTRELLAFRLNTWPRFSRNSP